MNQGRAHFPESAQEADLTSDNVMADIRSEMERTLATSNSIDVRSVIDRVVARHGNEKLSRNALEERVMIIAQEYNAPLSFERQEA